MITVEIGEPSLRRELYDPTRNHQNNATHLDLLPELREKSQIRNLAAKQRAAKKYNANLCPRSFISGDLVWRMASSTRKKDVKFSANWDGPYRLREDAKGGAYRLKHLSGEEIPNSGMHPTSCFTLVKHILYHIKTLVTLGVLFFLTWSFFPKEGFGQEVLTRHPRFNE